MTLVNLGPGERGAAGAEGTIPGGGQSIRIAIAESFALSRLIPAARAVFRDAAGAGEIFEEAELAFGGPVISAGLAWCIDQRGAQTGCCRTARFS